MIKRAQMNQIRFYLIFFLIWMYSCSEDANITMSEDGIVNVVRVEINYYNKNGQGVIGKYVFDRSTINSKISLDTLATTLPVWSDLEASVKLYTQEGNELNEITEEIRRYSNDYYININSKEAEIKYLPIDKDWNGHQLGLEWDVFTSGSSEGSVNFKLLKLEAIELFSNPTVLDSQSINQTLLDINFSGRVGS